MDHTERTARVVLVVDDEALLRMLVGDQFAEAGFEVVQAANGTEAIEHLRSRRDIRAVVTDVNMPGQPDGFTLSHVVRDLCPDCAIVVVSGRSAPGEGVMAERARYVPKPFEGPEVVQLVEDLLAA